MAEPGSRGHRKPPAGTEQVCSKCRGDTCVCLLGFRTVREGGIGDAGGEMIGEQVEATPTEGWPVCSEKHGSSLDLVERCELGEKAWEMCAFSSAPSLPSHTCRCLHGRSLVFSNAEQPKW